MYIYLRLSRGSHPLQQHAVPLLEMPPCLFQCPFLLSRQGMHLLHLLPRAIQTAYLYCRDFQHPLLAQSLQCRCRITDHAGKLRLRQRIRVMLVTIHNPVTQHLLLHLRPFQRIHDLPQLFPREHSRPTHQPFQFRLEQIIHGLFHLNNPLLQQRTHRHVHVFPSQ